MKGVGLGNLSYRVKESDISARLDCVGSLGISSHQPLTQSHDEHVLLLQAAREKKTIGFSRCSHGSAKNKLGNPNANSSS